MRSDGKWTASYRRVFVTKDGITAAKQCFKAQIGWRIGQLINYYMIKIIFI